MRCEDLARACREGYEEGNREPRIPLILLGVVVRRVSSVVPCLAACMRVCFARACLSDSFLPQGLQHRLRLRDTRTAIRIATRSIATRVGTCTTTAGRALPPAPGIAPRARLPAITLALVAAATTAAVTACFRLASVPGVARVVSRPPGGSRGGLG